MAEVLNYKENEDGSATIELELTEQEKQILLEYAITRVLEDYINERN